MVIKGTTVIGIVRNGKAAIAADGQITLGDQILKTNARKIRKLYKDKILAGFAGSAADSLTLFERFENQLQATGGNLQRAAVQLAKDWRTDRALRRLEALLAVLDKSRALIISGSGDVIEPEDGIVAIGSGAGYALAAARALLEYSQLDIVDIVKKSIEIAGSICLYTNTNVTIEVLE